MNKSVLVLLASVMALFAAMSVCIAEPYVVIQLTDNTGNDYSPQVNANGYIVWSGYDGPDEEIFLYDGSSIAPLTDNAYDDNNPQINTNGSVVWMGNDGSDYEIFLYDGTGTTQLTDNSYDDQHPQINANGNIVWYGADGTDDEIFLYDGSSTVQLTDNAYNDWDPQINANGYVVWRGNDGSDYEIFLYDGSSISQLTDNTYDDDAPQINANGCVVWSGNDGSDYEIFLYDGLSTTPLTNNVKDDKYPQINDNGHVVWSGSDFVRYQIFLYDGSNTTQLTNDAYDDVNSQINDNGYVVWEGYDHSDWEVFLYDGTATTPLTNDIDTVYSWGYPQINDDGYLVWSGYDGSDVEIFYATPACAADFSATPLTGMAPLTVSFSDLSVGDIGTWSWDFDNDGIEDATAQNPTYTYDSQGTYTVSLTVSGLCGSDTQTKVDYLNVSHCLADFSATPLTGMAPLTVSFSDLSVGDIGTWSWDFDNDGTEDSTQQNPAHLFESGGTYTVSLTVSGLCGSGTETKASYLNFSACTADFSATPLTGMAPLTVSFSDLSTGDFDTWSWDFDNDGTEDATEQNPTYTYDSGGTHTVKLTVSGSHGLDDDEVKAHYIRILQPYSRPSPLMDYVPQETGIDDTRYEYLTTPDCRWCHGDSLVSRHHYSEQADNCALCHEEVPQPPDNWPPELVWPPRGQPWPPGIDPPAEPIIRDCLAGGCHSWDDVDTNGWHHNNELSASNNCAACHDRNIAGEFWPGVPGVSFADDPPKVAPPTIHTCENCHWYQAVEASAPGFDPASSPQIDAGHPSTYDHLDAWGVYQGYFEYQINICGNQSTHMKEKTNYVDSCTTCHSLDDMTTNFDPFDPETIRACERCHTKETLHAVHRQDFYGWEAVGFHASGNPGTSPETYRLFTSDEMCVGCHGSVPPIPAIARLRPRSLRPDMALKIIGSNFGDTQGNSVVHINDQTFDSTSAKIRLWSDTKIKLRVPKYKRKWFKGRDFRRQKVWVTVNGLDSNEKRLKIFRPCKCDLNRDGVCDDDDAELLTQDMNSTDCNELGVNCKGDLNKDGVVDGVDFGLFMDAYARKDCKQL
jgi:PKD repeat protein